MSVRRRYFAIASAVAVAALGAGTTAPAFADDATPAAMVRQDQNSTADDTPQTRTTPEQWRRQEIQEQKEVAAREKADREAEEWRRQEIQEQKEVAAREKADREAEEWKRQEIQEQKEVAAREKADREAEEWKRQEIQEQKEVAAREKADQAPRRKAAHHPTAGHTADRDTVKASLSSRDLVTLDFTRPGHRHDFVAAGSGVRPFKPGPSGAAVVRDKVVVEDASLARLATGHIVFRRNPASGQFEMDRAASQLPCGLSVKRTAGNTYAFTWDASQHHS